MRKGIKTIVDQVMPLGEAAPKVQGNITATITWAGKSDRFDKRGKTVEEIRKMLDPVVKKSGVLSYKVKG